MNIKNLSRLVCTLFVLIFLGSLPSIASAEIIDDMTARTDANGEVDLVVKFAFQIQYLRNFPQGKTDYTAIYFNALGSVPAADWQNYESRRAPPSDLIRDVFVSTSNKATGPTVEIKLTREAEMSVSLGKNGQSLVIHIKPGVTTLPSPEISAAPVAPSGDITPPKVTLPVTTQKAVHIPLGGKDGLPNFPDIDQPVQLPEQASANTATEPPTLVEQITKANNQASTLMIQGGNALLTGQTFIAIDAFNSLLKLQPNKYSEDAQFWIGIAKERGAQLPKAILEYNTYLKLYPNGKAAKWVKDRLAVLKASQPSLFANSFGLNAVVLPVQNTEFQYSEFGSMSVEGYLGASQTSTLATVGTTVSPTTVAATDQKSVMTNVNMTARANNNEYDNRLVFQDFYSANYLPGQPNTSRVGAAFYEIKDRVENYSVRIGRQSGMGGGVMGLFDGVAAGYGLGPDYKVNVVAGQLSDISFDEQPKFKGASLDFGIKSPLGGSAYFIDQTVYGITDRRAVGGNLRYFEPSFNIMSMLDYDLLFMAPNFMTIQGTINGGGKDNDYNFLLDHRKSPILDLRNAVTGSTVTFNSLLQNGMTTSDLVGWANQRTTTTSTAGAGMINHLSDKWITGTDISYTITDALAASGLTDPASGVCIDVMVGCVPTTPSTGPTWSFSQRLTGTGVFLPRDVSNLGVNYTKSMTSTAESFQLSNHADMSEKWTLDTILSLAHQTDNVGGKSDNFSPTGRVSYKMKNNLTLDSQLGLTWSTTSNSTLLTSSRTFQDFVSAGFRFDF